MTREELVRHRDTHTRSTTTEAVAHTRVGEAVAVAHTRVGMVRCRARRGRPATFWSIVWSMEGGGRSAHSHSGIIVIIIIIIIIISGSSSSNNSSNSNYCSSIRWQPPTVTFPLHLHVSVGVGGGLLVHTRI